MPESVSGREGCLIGQETAADFRACLKHRQAGAARMFFKINLFFKRNTCMEKTFVFNGFCPYNLSGAMCFVTVLVRADLVFESGTREQSVPSNKADTMITEIHGMGFVFLVTGAGGIVLYFGKSEGEAVENSNGSPSI